MKKKLLMVAVGAALSAGAMAVNAAPTVYGRLHVSIDKFDNGGPDAVANQPDGINISSNTSRFGIKGSEDLGDGLKGLYQVELGFNADETGSSSVNTFSQRNSYAGLAGNFGTVLAGRHDTPYKLATGSLDPFSETVGDYNTIIGNVNGSNQFDLRVSNALAYVSPNWNGVSVIAAYSWDPLQPATGTQANGADVQAVKATSLAVMFTQGPLFVTGAYEKHDVDNAFAANISRSATKVGGGFDFGIAKVGAVVEKMEHDTATSAFNRDALWATASGPFLGNNLWAVAYGVAKDSDAPSPDDGGKLMTAGVFHNFSKTFRVYAVYAKVSNDAGGTYRPGDSGHGDVVSGVAGKDGTSLSLGVISDF